MWYDTIGTTWATPPTALVHRQQSRFCTEVNEEIAIA
jgi:hypothetical protein